MKLIEVGDTQTRKEFLEFPVRLFAKDIEYIRPLDKDIDEVFDVAKNKFFKSGECQRWLLQDEAGNTIGKIAAFVSKKYKNDFPVGGIGFFDCIDDQTAADFMFNHSIVWLKERGMEGMDGPINFGERDKWWGLLIEGFKAPLYGMNYHLPYYKTLFENFGFQVYFYQLCFGRKVHDSLSEQFFTLHKRHSENPDYTSKNVQASLWQEFAKDFTKVYNDAWASHDGGKSIDERQARAIFKSMKPVIDENIAWFAYYKNEPIAMWINLPDLNQWFKSLNGQFNFFRKLQFLWLKKFRPNPRFVGVVFGVAKAFQKKGIESFIIVEGGNVIRSKTAYQSYEMQWIGDFNPSMVKIAQNLETEVTRRLATYRYLFDRNAEFVRHPMLT